jgi:hypothetical protein
MMNVQTHKHKDEQVKLILLLDDVIFEWWET